jgi:adenine-specific DNA-methyltransferase
MTGKPENFLDGFLGTGVITAELLKYGIRKITVVDNLLLNTTIFKGFSACPKNLKEIKKHLDILNSLPGKSGYLTKHYAQSYFTKENCELMDNVRETINNLYLSNLLNDDEYHYLLTSFLLGADRIANTIGQYDAFLKHIGKAAYKKGRHIVDVRVYSPFKLRTLELIPAADFDILTADLLECLDKIDCETAYFDPPYNARQYCDNYHVLENIARWQKPDLFGVTKKFNRSHLKSSFSQRRQVKKSFCDLLSLVRAKHIFISYNSEGLINIDDLYKILLQFGSVRKWEFPYPVFGKGAGVAKKRKITEYLFYIRKS